ncbi:MAG: hypothetical protein FWH48_01955 [Oscillospiraceae bacterium]|nr:hypothetical protein [Oscillospiraceae bacterium]
MEYDQVNRSAILELVTYVIAESENKIEDNKKLKDVLGNLKIELSSTEPPKDFEQTIRYIEQVELAMSYDPSIGEITVLRTSQGKYDSPMNAACFSDGGTLYVQYRGTPEGGWVQNPISFGTDIGEYMDADGMSSQIQADGLDFFDDCVNDFMLNGDASELVIGGHSQGGNVAEYVTMMSGYGALIDMCVALDAPNHSEKLYDYVQSYGEDHFAEQSGKIIAINGNNDYVNMLGQKSFAPEEYYINTNEAWAMANGHDALIGGHDMLYMMDFEYGGLIANIDQPWGKAKIEAIEQEEFWSKLSMAEYAEFFPYLSIKEQLEFLNHFPAKQQAQILLLLPSEQQTQKQPPRIVPTQTEEVKKQNMKKAAEEAASEFEFKRQAPEKMAQALQGIEDAREDAFWGKLPLGEYADFLTYLLPEEVAAFLDLIPQKYQEQIIAQLTPWQQERLKKYRETGELSTLWELPNAREQALAKRDEAEKQICLMIFSKNLRENQDGQQGPMGLLMTEIVKTVNELPQDQKNSSVLTLMSILELMRGSKDPYDLINIGFKEEDMLALVYQTLPILIKLLEKNASLADKAGRMLLPEGGLYTGIFTILVMFLHLSFLDLPLYQNAKLIVPSEIEDQLRVILEPYFKKVAVIKERPLAPTSKYQIELNIEYVKNNPYISINTDRARECMVRMQKIIAKLQVQIGELRTKIKQEEEKDEEERDEVFIESCRNSINALQKGIPDMESIARYFLDLADIFEKAEDKIYAYTKGG